VEYRSLGSIAFKPSALGFGTMRLPEKKQGASPAGPGEPDLGSIDHKAATAMLRYAVEHGVNYIDTAYNYHGGASEVWLGRALRDVARVLDGEGDAGWAAFRRRVKVATKLPAWKCECLADFDRYFDEQRERLRIESLDFYLLHSLDADSWAQVRDAGVLDWAKRMKRAGRIGWFGFSFHGDPATFKEIVAATKLWDFCQIQYNYMDEEHQAGTEGLRYAAARGLGVVVMEPVRGGHLAGDPPQRVAELWRRSEADDFDGAPRTPADWALQWVWDHPEVGVVLSGMSTMRQVVENVASAERSGAGRLTDAERALVASVREAYRELAPIACTACDYCQPCREGVEIPDIFAIYNDAVMYGNEEAARESYAWIAEEHRADRCTHCGECEARCPQKLPVTDWLEVCQRFLCAPADAGS
jgi:predicted aldo/keto reductase-like oxidoreductase